MARGRKPLRISKSESYFFNKKYFGDEPNFTKAVSNSQYADALNWYNYMSSVTEGRTYVETYLKSLNRLIELKKFKSVGDNQVSTTMCWIARMLNRGFELPESAKPFFEQKLSETLTKAKEETPVAVEVATVSVQDRIREKTHDIVGEIESMIDLNESFSLYDWLVKNQISSIYCNAIVERYAPWLDELIQVSEGKDPQLKEAYAHMSKAEINKRIQYLNTLVEDAERYSDTNKKVRKKRKPRTVSVEKQLKNFKYQKENTEFKIASINPEKVIGANELWTFNTKYKVLTVFRAINRSGLQIKGTTVLNFDEANSSSKKIGRKTEEYLKKVLDGGKIVLRKLMTEIKTDAPMASRINENTVLLRVN